MSGGGGGFADEAGVAVDDPVGVVAVGQPDAVYDAGGAGGAVGVVSL